MKNKNLLLLILAAFVSGCTNGVFAPTDEGRSLEKLKMEKRGAAREVLFVKCMELAAKMPRQSDDDVSDVVQECSTQAYYMTNHIE